MDFMKLRIGSPLRVPCYLDKSAGLTFTSALQNLSLKKKKRECESDRERSILDVLSERGSVLERVSYTCGVQTGFTLTSDFAVH